MTKKTQASEGEKLKKTHAKKRGLKKTHACTRS